MALPCQAMALNAASNFAAGCAHVDAGARDGHRLILPLTSPQHHLKRKFDRHHVSHHGFGQRAPFKVNRDQIRHGKLLLGQVLVGSAPLQPAPLQPSPPLPRLAAMPSHGPAMP
eukprot:CAMPEP_0119344760 /NCGR_PEP_ID=MMETSP1333-20130426/107135_1 /TAXON_ID=418940 /ORGANISM="Scyphosphaera apsteinii, Strain RCC1455" /LENGTH=113 /DNA_ID=CAMNT_0007357207 /DNA_START=369 /DNA_END=707 /DNA_ORIENTATION=+